MDTPAYSEIVQRNARRWEAMAQYRHGMTLDQHRGGISALEPEELELLGDLQGQCVLHLACSVSDEGISMATQGASVVGVDISPTHVRVGQEKASALGVDVTLRVGNMMQLDGDLCQHTFDLVYISTGGLCWVPDLDDWLTGVTSALKPGGRLLISEHHPLWETLGVAGDRQMIVLRDYFGAQDIPVIHDPVKSAIGTVETASDENQLQHFVWGLGTLVSALIRHDIRISALLELPDAEMYRGLGAATTCIPAVYRLLGQFHPQAAESDRNPV